MGRPAPRGRTVRQSGPTAADAHGKNPSGESGQSEARRRARTCRAGVLAEAQRCLRGELQIVANCPPGVSTSWSDALPPPPFHFPVSFPPPTVPVVLSRVLPCIAKDGIRVEEYHVCKFIFEE